MSLNVNVLESSFKLVAPQGEKLVTRFYERLFQKYPAVKPLFNQSSMKAQKKNYWPHSYSSFKTSATPIS